MTLVCTRCEGSGFINIHQVDAETLNHADTDDHHEIIKDWIESTDNHDVSVCDCCGDTEQWYGEPGWHYTKDDPAGNGGHYSYNGGLCECN